MFHLTDKALLLEDSKKYRRLLSLTAAPVPGNAANALPVAVAVTGRGLEEVLVAAGICALVLVRHVANIRRLVAGEEGSWNR